jgi:ABC-2 type transport system ATP-binding protein
MIEVAGLVKRYGARAALAGISFSVGRGEVVGFLGANGAGKSTTMRILSGFIAPSEGRARVAGGDPRLPATRRKIGYLPETNPLPPRLRVGEYLRFRAGVKGLSRAAARRAAAESAERCRLTDSLGRMIGRLSKGMRQRVGLADSLLAGPEVLILDEPTSGLDPAQAEETRSLIAEAGRGGTVFLSSHILGDIERLCRRVLILDRGVLAADGDPADISEKYAGERTLRLELEAGEDEKSVREKLLALAGVLQAETAPNPGGAGLVARLTLAPGTEARRETALAAVRNGWLVTGMRLEPARLEDVFRKLAGGGSPGHPRETRESESGKISGGDGASP